MLKAWIFPDRCPACRRVHRMDESGFCRQCQKKLSFVGESVCVICGKPVDEGEEYCASCPGTTHYFAQNRSWLLYEGAAKKAMYHFKYQNARWIAPVLAAGMIRQYKMWLKLHAPQAIIPVPVHKTKERERGHNQAMELAKALQKNMEKEGVGNRIPIFPAVRRTRYTLPQKELSPAIRRKNMKKAFKLDKSVVKSESIYLNGGSALFSGVLLVDDIYTTGATLDAISELLLAGHIAETVYTMTAMIGRGQGK